MGADSFLEERIESIMDDFQVSLGTIMHPLSAWFALNNSHTIHKDMQTFSENALVVARLLEASPVVVRVHYPFLHSYRHKDIATRQMKAGGGLLSFDVGSFNAARTLVESLDDLARL